MVRIGAAFDRNAISFVERRTNAKAGVSSTLVVARTDDWISGSARVFWQQVPRKASSLTDSFCDLPLAWDLLCLQQHDGFVLDWLAASLRQQLLPSVDVEQQPVPLQQ